MSLSNNTLARYFRASVSFVQDVDLTNEPKAVLVLRVRVNQKLE